MDKTQSAEGKAHKSCGAAESPAREKCVHRYQRVATICQN